MGVLSISELKIGNLVFDHLNRILKVSGIKENYVYCELSNKEKVKYHVNTFKPIPLTEEWLLNFGFELSENDAWFDKDDISVSKSNYVSIAFGGSWCKIDIKLNYVHQLQNFYFALTNEELTIKNK